MYKQILNQNVISSLSTSLKINSDEKSLKLIASGGISTFDEIPKLAGNGCEGVIIGKAIYENKISLKQLEKYIVGGL
jgi:phosphoribosylformimino-5-aminoimidazole carboxamide ribotide isomerase